MNANNNIANRIKISRKVAELTHQELADRVGAALITIVRWENPESGRNPNTVMINELAEKMNTSARYLMGLEDMPEK
jgi:transcriptional regulator with XRE-family HTH domain